MSAIKSSARRVCTPETLTGRNGLQKLTLKSQSLEGVAHLSNGLAEMREDRCDPEHDLRLRVPSLRDGCPAGRRPPCRERYRCDVLARCRVAASDRTLRAAAVGARHLERIHQGLDRGPADREWP